MTGERELGRLLAGLDPALDPRPYLFAAVPGGSEGPLALAVFALVREEEGTTAVIDAEVAERGRAGRRPALRAHHAPRPLGPGGGRVDRRRRRPPGRRRHRGEPALGPAPRSSARALGRAHAGARRAPRARQRGPCGSRPSLSDATPARPPAAERRLAHPPRWNASCERRASLRLAQGSRGASSSGYFGRTCAHPRAPGASLLGCAGGRLRSHLAGGSVRARPRSPAPPWCSTCQLLPLSAAR